MSELTKHDNQACTPAADTFNLNMSVIRLPKLLQILGISRSTVYLGVVAQMPVAAEVGSGDERDELGSG